MEPLGYHYLIELYGCNYNIINNKKKIKNISKETAKIANATIIKPFFHKFRPYGVSGVVVIAESHITIHTWPEYKYCAADFFTCSAKMKTDESIEYLVKELEAEKWFIEKRERGYIDETKQNFLNSENYDKSIWRKYEK